MNIVVIGSINTDLVINTSRLPKMGETVSGSGFSVNCGGKGVNQAVATARLGGNVSFIGAVGGDENGLMALENLKMCGIDTRGVSKTDVNTGVAVITVCNGDNCIILDAGANGLVNKDIIDKNKDIIKGADAVIMQLEIPMETVLYAAKIANASGVKVILNPAPVADLPPELINKTDVLILNETEAEFLTKVYPDCDKNRRICLENLKAMGAKNVILTLGGDGVIYTDKEEIKYQAAFKANVVDTTAAGDTFIGAYCIKMKEDTEYAVRYSAAAAAITVSREGASKSIPTQAEVEKLMLLKTDS